MLSRMSLLSKEKDYNHHNHLAWLIALIYIQILKKFSRNLLETEIIVIILTHISSMKETTNINL